MHYFKLMITSFWIILLIIATGLVLVILPDHDKSLFNFNKDHGPSLQDFFGLILIVLGWWFLLIRIIFKRKTVLKSVGKRNTLLLAIMIVAGLAFIIGGLRMERDSLLWIGVLFSILGYGVLLTPAFRKS